MNAKIPGWLTALLIIGLVVACVVGYDFVKARALQHTREQCRMAGNPCSVGGMRDRAESLQNAAELCLAGVTAYCSR